MSDLEHDGNEDNLGRRWPDRRIEIILHQKEHSIRELERECDSLRAKGDRLRNILQALFYVLLRDYLVPGTVEAIFIEHVEKNPQLERNYSNPHIAAYAGELADRLLQTTQFRLRQKLYDAQPERDRLRAEVESLTHEGDASGAKHARRGNGLGMDSVFNRTA